VVGCSLQRPDARKHAQRGCGALEARAKPWSEAEGSQSDDKVVIDYVYCGTNVSAFSWICLFCFFGVPLGSFAPKRSYLLPCLIWDAYIDCCNA
jgi:hypothetical protein